MSQCIKNMNERIRKMGLTGCSARLPYLVDSEELGRTLLPLLLFDLVR